MSERLARELGNALLAKGRDEWDRLSGELYDSMKDNAEEYDEVLVLDVLTVTRLPRTMSSVVSVSIYESPSTPVDDKPDFIRFVSDLATSGGLR